MWTVLKKYLGLQKNLSNQNEIMMYIYKDIHKQNKYLHIAIIIFELLMMTAISMRSGGPFYKPRRIAYFIMYLIMILVTSTVVFIENRFIKKKLDNYKYYFLVEYIYMFFFCIWGVGITLNDQLGGNGLTVFNYTVLIASIFAMMKPWQSYLLFIGNFALLNILLPCFPDPFGLDQRFNNFMNSLFISFIAILISNCFYKSKITIKNNEIVIKNQYLQIKKDHTILKKEIQIDTLTQLHNRRYLKEVVTNRIQEIQEKNSFIGCMMIDIDFFKSYNDFYGHIKGDQLLSNIAQYFKEILCMDNIDIIRYGGEEFVVFVYNEEINDIIKKAEKIIDGLNKKKYVHEGSQCGYVTVSIGIHIVNSNDSNIKIGYLISCADSALYEAKKSGRNKIVIYKNTYSM